ncbi:MAG: hypothetical protein ACYDB7_08005 [Mycobacteriales bacterium]
MATKHAQAGSAVPVMLIIGYLLAVPPLLVFFRMWRRREPALFAAEEVGAALVAAGWALDGDAVSTAINSVWCAGFAVAYALEGRKRARAAVPRAE